MSIRVEQMLLFLGTLPLVFFRTAAQSVKQTHVIATSANDRVPPLVVAGKGRLGLTPVTGHLGSHVISLRKCCSNAEKQL
jgi:hypothetical protein